MSIIKYFTKETYFKIIYLFILFIFTLIIIINKIKILFLFILSPLKKIKIDNFFINYENSYDSYILLQNTEEINNLFIPIIEINLPFFTTSYIYSKYIILFTIYILIPIILYYIYISIANILKKKELLEIKNLFLILLLYNYINYIITHYIIVPLYINFIYGHYNEYLFYEFDVEFQLLIYLNFYFNTLFINYFLFIILLLKKYFKLNIYNVVLLIILLMIIPFDTIIQITYIILFISYNIINNFINNYITNIKKYKQMEYLETY